MKNKKLILSLLLVGITIIVYISISNLFDKKVHNLENSRQNTYNKQFSNVSTAWAYMQTFVEKELNSSYSIDFPEKGSSEDVLDLGKGRYKINSQAKINAEGTTILFNGIIKVENGKWIKESLNIKQVKKKSPKKSSYSSVNSNNNFENCTAGCAVLCDNDASCPSNGAIRGAWMTSCITACMN